MDDLFQFVDCREVDFDDLARDIRSGVIEIKYPKIVISIGNQAAMDNCTNLVVPTNAIINALVERFGCLNIRIWVANVILRPDASPSVVQVIRKQNKGLWKAVRALV